MKLSAVKGTSSWRIDYLYDEEGTVWGGVYRSPASSTSPVYFSIITTDRGDVACLCDADGNAFAAYRYDAWGSPQGAGTYATGIWTQGTSLMTSTLAGEIASRQVVRYASYVWDAESALYYCSARYYDPATRQWTTGDPAKADGEESAYQYCAGEPVGRVDASGRVSCPYPKWWVRLYSRNDRGYRTESWYYCKQLPDPDKTYTCDGVYVVYRVGARNISRGRWIAWHCLVERPTWWGFWREWKEIHRKDYVASGETRTQSVLWWSSEVINSCVRTWGWGGWSSDAFGFADDRTGWCSVYYAAEEIRK
jgi:RHS repeat-associated protein